MALTRPRYSQIYDTDYKQSVRVATTADVGNLLATGNMTNSIDGKTLVVNDRILVKDQTDLKQNGIYRVSVVGTGSNGTWIRALDADASDKVTSGMTTIVSEGDTNAAKTFRLSTPDPIVLGTTNLTFIDPFTAGFTPSGANTQVQFNDGGSVGASSNFTFDKSNNTVTSTNLKVTGNLTLLGSSLAAVYGGTGITSYTKGDILYASNTNILSVLTIGSLGEVLQVDANGVPFWGNIDAGFY